MERESTTGTIRRPAPVGTPLAERIVDLVCAQCGTTVTIKTRGGSPQRYCGEECRLKATSAMTTARKRAAREARTAAPLPPPSRPTGAPCTICGSAMPAATGGSQRRYCSTDCKNVARCARAAEKRRLETIVCEVCGTVTTATTRQGGHRLRFCGRACRKRWHNQRRHRGASGTTYAERMAEQRQRACAVCDKPYVPLSSHPKQEACSPSCGAKLRERRARARLEVAS